VFIIYFMSAPFVKTSKKGGARRGSEETLVAIDDVGTGYSGLSSIADIRPDSSKWIS